MALIKSDIASKMKSLRQRLEEMREYKRILNEDGMRPDAADKMLESKLIQQLMGLEKDLARMDAVRGGPRPADTNTKVSSAYKKPKGMLEGVKKDYSKVKPKAPDKGPSKRREKPTAKGPESRDVRPEFPREKSAPFARAKAKAQGETPAKRKTQGGDKGKARGGKPAASEAPRRGKPVVRGSTPSPAAGVASPGRPPKGPKPKTDKTVGTKGPAKGPRPKKAGRRNGAPSKKR